MKLNRTISRLQFSSFIMLLYLILVAPPAIAENVKFVSTTADVAAWNLAGFTPIPKAKIPQFIRAISDLDPEVLALVEVNPDWVAAEIVAELNESNNCYRRKILEQTANQNIAILYKCGVIVSNPRLIAGSDNGNSALRKALVADIKMGEFDFLLIAVHMKASRGSSNRQIRDNQASAIATFIQTATSGSEKDVLVIGDYNMIPVQDQSNFDAMSPTNFLNYISSADLAGQFSHISSSGPGNLLDGYAISQGHTSEYIAGSLRIFPLHQAFGLSLLAYRNQVSDHLPLIAKFRITQDDD